jgi:hypothetical protein
MIVRVNQRRHPQQRIGGARRAVHGLHPAAIDLNPACGRDRLVGSRNQISAGERPQEARRRSESTPFASPLALA